MNTETGLLEKFGAKIAIAVLVLLLLGFCVGRLTAPADGTLYQQEKGKREAAEQVALGKIAENERLKADLQGGRTAAEEREALKKREEELTRRENILNKREDDLENREREFNSTVRSTGEEVGQATQLRKDYEDTKQLLIEVSKARNVWRNSFWVATIFIFCFLVFSVSTYIYIRKLQYSNNSLEKAMRMLQNQFQNPSVTVEEVKTVFETSVQLIEAEQTSKQKLLKSNSESKKATT